jgi:subtilisin-like proprotein convertase family protein
VGTFRPETPLSALNGKSGAAVNGTWRLEVADEFPVGVGTLQCWTLNVTARTCDDGGGACPATPTPTPTATATPDPTATGTPTSIISVQDVSQLEGSGGGFSTFRFRVSMFPARSLDTMVEYTTINGTAMQPGDYTDTSGTLVIPAQTPFADINVPVVRDNTFESNEFFRVRLSNPAAGGIVGGDGFGTILNDDPSPTRTPTRTRTPTALRQVPGAGEVGAPSGGETLPTTERNGVLLLAVLALLGSSLALRRRPRRNR